MSRYPEFSRDERTGLIYRDYRVGEGAQFAEGDRVAVDWAAYTVHRGFVVEGKRLTKGGAFEGDDADLLRFRVGDGTVIGAVDEAVRGMRAGGVRRLLVPPGPLSYPAGPGGKQSFESVGPVPSTFSGKRALDQVLTNPGNIDKSLVIDVELLEVSPAGGPGRLVGGPGTGGVAWDKLGGTRQAGGLYQAG